MGRGRSIVCGKRGDNTNTTLTEGKTRRRATKNTHDAGDGGGVRQKKQQDVVVLE